MLHFLYLDCEVNGQQGDGRQQGDCPNGEICFGDGKCRCKFKKIIATIFSILNNISSVFENIHEDDVFPFFSM